MQQFTDSSRAWQHSLAGAATQQRMRAIDTRIMCVIRVSSARTASESRVSALGDFASDIVRCHLLSIVPPITQVHASQRSYTNEVAPMLAELSADNDLNSMQGRATLPSTLARQTPATAPLLLEWQQLTEHLAGVLYAPQTCGNTVAQIEQCAGLLKRLAHLDPDLAIFFVVSDHPDKLARYSVAHALHTAILVSIVSRSKGWSASRELCGIKAALTMNISVTQLQDELSRQAAPLTPEQRHAVRQHPMASRKLLVQLGVNDIEWLEAVAHHHEQADGRGYPYGATDVSALADAVRTADVFSAKLSPRIHRNGMLSPKAAAEIFKHSSASHFGATIIRELGLYPPGCLVQLSSGETAMVLRRTGDPLCPEVALLTTDEGQPLDAPQRSQTGSAHDRTLRCAAANPALAVRFAPEDLYR